MSTKTPAAEAELIAWTIRAQITAYPLMLQGAREFYHGDFEPIPGHRRPGMRCTIKPKTRLLRLFVLLEPSDTYTVVVTTPGTIRKEAKELNRWEGVYAEDLAGIVADLDRTL